MIQERILKKFWSTKISAHYTTRKKGTLPFFYNIKLDFTAKLKVKEFNYILKFKTNGIHTFFMKTNIDVILTDKNQKVLYIYKKLKPNKIILPKRKVKYTYEMPVNYIKNIKIGDNLNLKS